MNDGADASAQVGQGECTIPPRIPIHVLPGLLYGRDPDAERAVREYVEWQTLDERVLHAEQVTTEIVLGRRLDAWDVHTDQQRWWVITSPTNLYSQELFPSLDYTISFHAGVTARVMSRNDPGVEPVERNRLASAWRRWQQAADALDEAEEVEDFQAVGMRCRESLIAFVKSVSKNEMVPNGEAVPKSSDVASWIEYIANHVALGSSAKHVRRYLKSVAVSCWQLVNWLTHSSSVTLADAVLAIDSTQHTLATSGTALFRMEHGIPDQCGNCGSYRLGLRMLDNEVESVPACRSCGAIVHSADEPSVS